MNIVWIEDFGGTQPLPANSKTLIPLFQGLLSREIFINKWDDDDDLLANTNLLSDFFNEHSTHKILLLRNVFDYLDHVENRDTASHDIYIIDINLTQGADLQRALPDGMEGIENPAFHRKAGFFIYNHLIRLGVPVEHICLLTGEQGSTIEFNAHCRDSLTPRPIAFEKSDSGYTAFRGWLNGHQANDYLALRRAVIEGCYFLKEIIKSDEFAIQFRVFIRPEQGKPSRDVTLEEMCDYLDTLRQFLPETRPTEVAGTNRIYRLFVRALAHEWESQADPEYPRNQPNYGGADRRLLPTLGWIMKNVRNWMSHNNAINNLDARNVAFLFIVNMRAMFRWDVAPARFEKQALALLTTGDARAILST
ncbi:MAG: hypothetical protein Q8Q28_13720 [Pseudomonadota bacterium]|nr:hypothetical protein [Pseudomonadota bacterium]